MQPEILLARYAPQVRNHALAANLFLALVYAATAWAGLRIAGIHPSVTGIWPPSGIALAAVLLGGIRLLPGIAVGAFGVALVTTGNPWEGLMVSAGNCIEAYAGYALLGSIPRFTARLDSVRAVVGLVGAALLAPLPSALIGSAALRAAGSVPPGQFETLIATWWLGNLLGILLVTPMILTWWARFRVDLRQRDTRAALWLLLLLGAVTFCVFDGRLNWLVEGPSALYFILPVAVLIALGEDLRACTLGNLMTVGFALWGLSHGRGPFTGPAESHVELYLAVVGGTTLLVNALSSERARVLIESQRNLDRFRALTSLSADWYWETDAQHRFTFISETFEARSGLRLADTLGRARYDLPVNHFESEAALREHQNHLNQHQPFKDLLLRREISPGVSRWASVSGEPVFDGRGEFLGYRGIGRDVTAEREASLEISASQQFLETLINAIDSPVLVKDEAHRYIAANAAFTVFFDRPMDEILGRNDFDFFSADKAEYFQRTDDDALRDGHAQYEAPYPVGSRLYWMQVRKSLSRLPDGRRVVVLVMMDITARKASEDRLADSERRFRDFAEAAGDYAFEVDLAGTFTFCSSRQGVFWGYAPEELLGKHPTDFMPADEAQRVRDWLAEHQQADGSFRDLEHTVLSKYGEERWILVNAIGMYDPSGTRVGLRGSARDITDRKTVEDRINFLATRDALTGLPNRVLFGDRITQAMAVARRTGQKLALCFMDLDRFKYINDTLGHDVGDLLLKQVAERMLACVRKRDTLARLGGDEFVLALEGLQHAEDVAQVAGKIIRAIAQPFEIGPHSLTTSCSIGISIFPNDAEDERVLMKNADTAMYHAKERGRNNFQFFSADMNTRAVERTQLESALRQAVKAGEFILHYQPRVDITSGRVVGVEALLRWNQMEKGLLGPSHFIEVAEDCGLLEPIGQWALREACLCLKGWDEKGYPPLTTSLNISPRQLIKPNEFVRGVLRTLQETGLDPARLELDVTESLLRHNAEEIVSALRKLTREGIRLTVDDFGAGNTSLSYLRQFPLSAIKVDRTLIRDIDSNPDHTSVVQAIVAMGHSLRLTIVAEGVETLEQLNALRALGCNEYQGNLFSKPMPPIDIAARFLAPGELDLRVLNP